MDTQTIQEWTDIFDEIARRRAETSERLAREINSADMSGKAKEYRLAVLLAYPVFYQSFASLSHIEREELRDRAREQLQRVQA